jgi:hypothetical protein
VGAYVKRLAVADVLLKFCMLHRSGVDAATCIMMDTSMCDIDAVGFQASRVYRE